ncbi:MAG: hypothetical protein IJF71_00565 [Clostridia bacterium]|nr:hypothetical protein [Clostridia bacterium]
MKRKSIKTACLLVGTTVGAGFASGREIVLFFHAGGGLLLLFSVLFSALYFAVGYGITLRCQKLGITTLRAFSQAAFGRAHRMLELLIDVGYLLLFATMLAGVDALAPWNLIGEFRLLTAITMLLCFVTVMGGMDGLMRANVLITPLMTVAVIAICVASAVKSGDISVWQAMTVRPIQAVCNVVLYVSMNLFNALGITVSVAEIAEKRTVKGAYIVSAAVLGIALSVIGVALFTADSAAILAEIPLLALCGAFGVLSEVIIAALIWCGVFTTMISSLFPLSGRLDNALGKRSTATALLIVAGYILSRMGFSQAVRVFYPLTGAVGAVAVVLFFIRTKKSSLAEIS